MIFFIFIAIVAHTFALWCIGDALCGIYKELKRRNDKDGV